MAPSHPLSCLAVSKSLTFGEGSEGSADKEISVNLPNDASARDLYLAVAAQRGLPVYQLKLVVTNLDLAYLVICLGTPLILWMEEIQFAPPKKPWNDDFPVKCQRTTVFSPWFQSGASKEFVHQYVPIQFLGCFLHARASGEGAQGAPALQRREGGRRRGGGEGSAAGGERRHFPGLGSHGGPLRVGTQRLSALLRARLRALCLGCFKAKKVPGWGTRFTYPYALWIAWL